MWGFLVNTDHRSARFEHSWLPPYTESKRTHSTTACTTTGIEMSASDANFQSQVASVLDALVKQATAELTKLFESRYQASAKATASNEGRPEQSETLETSSDPAKAHRKTHRSVGVQVDEGINVATEEQLDVKACPEEKCSPAKGKDCLNGRTQEVASTDIPPVEANEHTDPRDLVIKEDVEMVEVNTPKPESLTSKTPEMQVVSYASAGKRLKSPQKSPAKQKPALVQTENATDGSQDKCVSQLDLEADLQAPKPESSEEPVQGEPQQASVSTAKGTAYSPSPSDGAVGPIQVSLWHRICSVEENDNHLQLKLKLTSDEKLKQTCSVQLVNLLSVTKSSFVKDVDAANKDGAKSKTGLPVPKDLRPHQGAHTGHRLCCFTQCGDAVWRLQEVVDHSRDGYACNICGKRFKRRKILRRHERFHTGEKPYACSFCSKSFALRKSLRRHQRFHTGERPHSCLQCGKRFRLRENLKAHLRFHTGEKPYICKSCGKCFRISRNLEKHNLGRCIAFMSSFRNIAGL